MTAPQQQLVTVRYLAMPVALHRRTAAHHDALVRELALIDAGDDPGSVPARVLALSRELRERFEAFSASPRSEIEAAAEAGRTELDVVYVVPTEAASAVETMVDILEELEDYCQAGDLLTLVAPPDIVAYRRWFATELARQIRHREPPQPWQAPGTAQEPDAASGTAPCGGATTVEVQGDLDLVGAAELRSRLGDLLERGQHRITVDLRGCEFVDSVGISLLLTTQARCLDSGGTLLVTGLQPPVQSALGYAGVLGLLAGADDAP